MGDAARVLVMTAEELEALVERAVDRALSRRAEDDDLLTLEQAAAKLGTTPEALRKRVQRGHIRPDVSPRDGGAKGYGFARATIAAYARRNHGQTK